jgi:hypothetical protein
MTVRIAFDTWQLLDRLEGGHITEWYAGEGCVLHVMKTMTFCAAKSPHGIHPEWNGLPGAQYTIVNTTNGEYISLPYLSQVIRILNAFA